MRSDRHKARLFIDREYYEKLYKDDLQCILMWLKRLMLRDILFDATVGTVTSRRHKRRKQTWRRAVRTSLYQAITLLLLSGDVHPNQGPTKHPRGTCDTSVRSNQRRVVCDTCATWSHIKCVPIDRAAYERLSDSDEMWICIKCSLPFTHDPVNERQIHFS